MSLRPNERTDVRRNRYKVAVDVDEGRRRREDNLVEIRKNKREENLLKKRQLESLPVMIAGVLSNDNNMQLEATTQFRKLLSIERSPPIEEVIQSGVVPRFVEFLMREDLPQLQFEAAWALTNIASGTSENTQVVIDLGAVPIFVKLFASPSDDVCEQIIVKGVFGSLDLGGKPPPSFELTRPALPALERLIHSNDEEHIIESGALPCLLSFLTHNHKKSIKKEACWTISNITAGSKEQIQNVIEAGLIAPLVFLLQTAEFDIKKEAAWAISNATSGGTNEQIKYLVSEGCIKPLCDLLVCPDPRIVTVSLEGLENILKVGEMEKNSGNNGDVNLYAQLIDDAEGIEKIENLQSHNNHEIYEKAVKILEAYWMEEEEDNLGDGAQTGFNFGGDNVQVPAGFLVDDENKREENLLKKRQLLTSSQPLLTGVASVPTTAKLESLPVMVAGVLSNDKNMQLEATTQFRKLLSIERSPPIEEVIQSGVVPRFVEFLTREDLPQLQFEAAWALTNIASGTSENTKVVIDLGAVPIFVKLFASPSDDVCEQHIIESGALPCLLSFLTHNYKKSIKKEACWTISNITAGSKEQIQNVIEAGLIAPLVFLLQTAEFDIKKEAAWAISNATSGGTNEQIKYLVSEGCIKPLCDLLVCPDPRIVTVSLEGLENILKVGEMEKNSGNNGDVNLYAQLIDDAEGIEKIENLQSHNNHEIYEKAIKILEAYWMEEEEDNLGDGAQTGFNFGGDNVQVPAGFLVDDEGSVSGVKGHVQSGQVESSGQVSISCILVTEWSSHGLIVERCKCGSLVTAIYEGVEQGLFKEGILQAIGVGFVVFTRVQEIRILLTDVCLFTF
ncbi:hypothetical protein M8C21_018454 [Ambrosia artemisiifolia]|uniref:IBB domain-containing protein n=1 Tax=Ambrosia artemisiifolia TaxID=4212 RepID=A0AAD5BZ67_AMBAR|nr:hypothetical protein M8C21_018454 [Ambrosia artemisiifolia]